jgi:integrase
MGNAKGRRRRFGAVRQLGSGRWQARYRGPDGLMRAADHTFETKTDADQWLSRKEVEIVNGDWINPDGGRTAFAEFAAAWITERPGLRPKTVQLYRYLLRRYLMPTFGLDVLAEIREARVRRWRSELLESGSGSVTVAKAYRLLKAILNTAADDGLIRRNPCRIKGGGSEYSSERSVLTVGQVYRLAEVIGERYRALLLLGTFGSLRWGELAALRRIDVDLEACTVRIERSLTELSAGELFFSPPKSEAGRRVVAFPALIVPELRAHIDRFAHSGDDGLLFTSPAGMPLRNSNFRGRVWLAAVEEAGLPGLHFHDLRHTGNAFAAGTGANLRELMERMGHSSARAAMIYLHSSGERQRKIADALGELAQAELSKATPPGEDGKASGTYMARNGRPVST